MDEKKIVLPLTDEALAELNNMAGALENAVEAAQKTAGLKAEACLAQIAEKDKKISELKEASLKALQGMDAVINKLNSVLEQDGSGNNNN